jgi:hypothetical protein
MGSRGLDPGKPEPPADTYDDPTVRPPIGRELLGARANRASEDLCAAEAVADADAVAPPTDRVRGDRARWSSATDPPTGP